MSLSLLAQVFGGVGIFLLALSLLTQGLQAVSGTAVQRMLAHWTSSPLRGVTMGAVFTAILQSSSAMTVIVIGLVNATVLPLTHAIYVIFGSNIGTSMTAWLVSLVGFSFDIKALALPIIGLGMALQTFSRGLFLLTLGRILTGFGLFFIGIDILREAFSSYAAGMEQNFLNREGAGLILLLLIGFVMTVITQSSSASTALILTGAAGGIVDIAGGAVMVIGANLGTTSTAILTVIGASANAKRAALAHVIFNVLTAVAALCILPQLLGLVIQLEVALHMEVTPMVTLALFHTIFNVLGCLLLTPFVGRLAKFLAQRFRGAADDMATPQYLDKTTASIPALGVAAALRELARMTGPVQRLSLAAARDKNWHEQREALQQLSREIDGFAEQLGQEQMPADVLEKTQAVLRINRYLREILHLMPQTQAPLPQDMQAELLATVKLVFEQGRIVTAIPAQDAVVASQLTTFAAAYEQAKQELLAAASRKKLSVPQASTVLDDLRLYRRLVEQMVKAKRWLARHSESTTPL